MRPQPSRLVPRRESVTRPEIKEDVRRLRDQRLAIPQERRSKGRMRRAGSVHQPLHRRDPAATARDVDVFRADLLQGETHEFAAPLNARPVVELIWHAIFLLQLFRPELRREPRVFRRAAGPAALDYSPRRRQHDVWPGSCINTAIIVQGTPRGPDDRLRARRLCAGERWPPDRRRRPPMPGWKSTSPAPAGWNSTGQTALSATA